MPVTPRGYGDSVFTGTAADSVSRYAIRVWLPDRPGGLGAVTSRVGAVGGEIVGIEIIDRDGGQAIDDLFVELPDSVDSGLLLREICEVDGVHIEDVRPMHHAVSDGRVHAFEAALALAQARTGFEVCERLCVHAQLDTGAAWVAAVDTDVGSVIASTGDVPDDAWSVAFAMGQREAGSVAGSDALDAAPSHGYGTPDTIGIAFGSHHAIVVVMGRPGRGFLRQERRRLGLLTRLAAVRVAVPGCDSARETTQ